MSAEVLTQLRAGLAFKPKPSEHELALAHVPVNDVGIPNAIDDRVLLAMIREQSTTTLIIGEPGSGKSSLLAAASARAWNDFQAKPMPVALNVQCEPLDAAVLVKGVTQSLATVLAPMLSAEQHSQLQNKPRASGASKEWAVQESNLQPWD